MLRYLREKALVQEAYSEGKETTAAKLRQSLDMLRDSNTIGDVRGIGLLWGIELVVDKSSKTAFAPELNIAGRIAQAAAERGVLVYPIQGA